MTTPPTLSSFPSRLFPLRGWLLAALFLVVLAARALTTTGEAPLRPEWLIYVAAAALLRLWAGAHLGDHGNESRAQAPRLARTGPYRFSRNPLYVANILAASGLTLFANALPLTVELSFIVLVIAHHFLLVHHEERILAALHGDAYERYRREVPRWYGMMRPQGTLTSGQSNPSGPSSLSGSSSRDEEGGGRVTLPTLLRRQGRNVGYLALCVLTLWVAAAAPVAGALQGG